MQGQAPPHHLIPLAWVTMDSISDGSLLWPISQGCATERPGEARLSLKMTVEAAEQLAPEAWAGAS